MIKKTLKNFIYIILIIICLLSITGCSLVNNTDNKTIQDKANQEISYLEDEVLTIANKYAKGEYNVKISQETNEDEGGENNGGENQKSGDKNNIDKNDNSQSDNYEEEQSENNNNVQKLNWDEISKSTTNINDSLDTIILDLTDVQISNDDLINFRNQVNNLIFAVSNKDEKTLLLQTSVLYSLLPTYLEKYSDNKNEVNIMKLKSLITTSFIYSNIEDWENAKNTVLLAENKYKEMMDDLDYMKEYSYNLNKIYILLEEFKGAIDNEELELSKIKYITFIEKI